jgi:hypothetical protein
MASPASINFSLFWSYRANACWTTAWVGGFDDALEWMHRWKHKTGCR